jgi:hypothetical protein
MMSQRHRPSANPRSTTPRVACTLSGRFPNPCPTLHLPRVHGSSRSAHCSGLNFIEFSSGNSPKKSTRALRGCAGRPRAVSLEKGRVGEGVYLKKPVSSSRRFFTSRASNASSVTPAIVALHYRVTHSNNDNSASSANRCHPSRSLSSIRIIICRLAIVFTPPSKTYLRIPNCIYRLLLYTHPKKNQPTVFTFVKRVYKSISVLPRKCGRGPFLSREAGTGRRFVVVEKAKVVSSQPSQRKPRATASTESFVPKKISKTYLNTAKRVYRTFSAFSRKCKRWPATESAIRKCLF